MPIKPWKDLAIRDDYMFKLVMRQKPLCRRLIEMLLRIRVRDIRYLEDEKTIHPRHGSKGIRLDVYVEGNDAVYEIEMQVRRIGTEELSRRMRYYQSVIDQDFLKSGQPYKRLKLTIIIFICPYDPFGKGCHIYTFRHLCLEDSSIELGDGTEKVVLNTVGTMDDVPDDIKAFCGYVNGIASEDAFVQELDREIRRLKRIEEEEVSYMTYAMKLEEEREEGIRQGIQQGIEKMRTLARRLADDGRSADIPAVMADEELQKEMFQKYNIG